MAKEQKQNLSLSEINRKVQELNEKQLRILVVLMATGNDFTESYEIAKSYEQSQTNQ